MAKQFTEEDIYATKRMAEMEREDAKLCTCVLTSYLECPVCKNDYKGGM